MVTSETFRRKLGVPGYASLTQPTEAIEYETIDNTVGWVS